MPVYNPGNDIMRAYFEGLQIRHEREARTEAQKLAQEKFKQDKKEFDDLLNLRKQDQTLSEARQKAELAHRNFIEEQTVRSQFATGQRLPSQRDFAKMQLTKTDPSQIGYDDPGFSRTQEVQFSDGSRQVSDLAYPQDLASFQAQQIRTIAPAQAEAARLEANALMPTQIAVAIARTQHQRNNLLLREQIRAAQRAGDFENQQKLMREREGIQFNYAKQLKAMGSSPETNEALADSLIQGIHNGAKYSSLPQTEKKLVDAEYSKRGWVRPGETEFKPLDDTATIAQAISIAEKLAENHSRGKTDLNLTTHAGLKTGYGEAAQLHSQLVGLGGQLARSFGGEKGALALKDVERAVAASWSPTSTKAQNLQKVKEFRVILKNRILERLRKYPESQRKNILENRGLSNLDEFLGLKDELDSVTRVP